MPETMPRWTDYIPVDDLVPDPRNPKGHDEAGLDESLREFGYVESVNVDERTGMLISGHGRREMVLRARDEGDDPPDGIVVEDGRWLIPVGRGWSSKDDDEAYRYLIAANKWVERGGWVNDLLAAGLQALQETERGLSGTGFVDDEVEDLLASVAPPDDLDGLEARYGDPTESDMWPVLRFKVSPKSKTRYLALIEGRPGSDSDLFEFLLDLAEAGRIES